MTTLRFMTAGESHGPCLTAILEGLPAGLKLDEEAINRDLARRIDALESRYDEQFSQVFDAIKQLIAEDKTRKAKPPMGFL